MYVIVTLYIIYGLFRQKSRKNSKNLNFLNFPGDNSLFGRLFGRFSGVFAEYNFCKSALTGLIENNPPSLPFYSGGSVR